MPKKTGANYSDIRQIKRLMQNPNATAKGIAKVLGVPVTTVESFMVKGATDVKVTAPDTKPIDIPGIPKTET